MVCSIYVFFNLCFFHLSMVCSILWKNRFVQFMFVWYQTHIKAFYIYIYIYIYALSLPPTWPRFFSSGKPSYNSGSGWTGMESGRVSRGMLQMFPRRKKRCEKCRGKSHRKVKSSPESWVTPHGFSPGVRFGRRWGLVWRLAGSVSWLGGGPPGLPPVSPRTFFNSFSFCSC
jgi:hypothetical protein